MQSFLKRFAIILSVCIFLQDNHILFVHAHWNDAIQSKNSKLVKKEDDPSSKEHKRSKRFLGLIIGAIVAFVGLGVNIYEAIRGCKDTNPDIEKNVKRSEILVKRVNETLRRAHFDNAANNRTGKHFKELANQMVEMRQNLEDIDGLKTKIVHAMDEDYVSKVFSSKDKLQEKFNNLYKNGYVSPAEYENVFHEANSHFVEVTKHFDPLTPWLGIQTDYFAHMSRHISKTHARNFLLANSTIIAEAVKKIDDHYLKEDVITQFKSYIDADKLIKASLAFMKSVVQSITLKIISVEFAAAAGIGLALSGLSAAHTIYQAITFFKECDDKETKSYHIVAHLETELKSYNKMDESIRKHGREVVKEYDWLYKNISSDAVFEEMDEEYQLAVHEIDRNGDSGKVLDYLSRFKRDIKNVIVQLPANFGRLFDYSKVSRLMNQANAALKINHRKMLCFHAKITFIAGITRDCASGRITQDSIWKSAQRFDQIMSRACPNNGKKLTKEELLKVVKNILKVKNKSKTCIKDGVSIPKKDYKVSICEAVKTDQSTSMIVTEHMRRFGLQPHVVFRIIRECQQGVTTNDLTARVKQFICQLKIQNQPLEIIKRRFPQYTQNQLESAYRDCSKTVSALTAYEKQKICELKSQFSVLRAVQSRYPQHIVEVASVYENCLPDKVMVCKVVYGQLPREIAMKMFKFYSHDVLKKLTQVCLNDNRKTGFYYGYSLQVPTANIYKVCRDADISYSYAFLQNPVTKTSLDDMLPLCHAIRSET